MIPRRSLLRALGSLVPLGALPGCAAPFRGPAVPVDRADRATVLGIANARFRGSIGIPALEREFAEADARQLPAQRLPAQRLVAGATRTPSVHLLALSGGGHDGAFGAGLLNGWTDAGNRPVFNVVTGISTGALIAPFAFVGSAHDPQLRAAYTEVTPRNILSMRWLPTALFSDALADSAPLYGLIANDMDEAMLAEIARGYDAGRLLLIFSTDLDAQAPVCWNIGAIAKSGHPGAAGLVRRILLASAAIPGAFPPVMIDVEADGERYQEMHVDGGVFAQVFLYPRTVTESRRAALRLHRPVPETHAYIVRNARLDARWSSVNRRFVTIAGRAVSTMITAGGFNDIIRTYLQTREDGVHFNLAFISSDFAGEAAYPFDPGYMRALYAYGYERARNASVWVHLPPILTLTPTTP
jgi:predicted acylesterase/phospholipase RssA